MSQLKKWISYHEEIGGVICLLAVTMVLSLVAYGISAATAGRGGSKITEVAQTEEATQEAPTQVAESEAPTEPAPTQPAPAQGQPAGEALAPGTVVSEFGVQFTITADEQITAVDETNLRRIPSTESDEDIVTKIFNGDVVTRTGTSENGWSRIVYNGQILYGATNLLKPAE